MEGDEEARESGLGLVRGEIEPNEWRDGLDWGVGGEDDDEGEEWKRDRQFDSKTAIGLT